MYQGLKALIIEDRRENIVFLANNILKPKGFEVITAMDGESGLRKALEEQPDVIITDLNLPKLHGLDILADLNDRNCRIPTIVMTFQGSEETVIKAFRLGAKDYLVKPFTVDDIDAALKRVWPDAPPQSKTSAAVAPVKAVVPPPDPVAPSPPAEDPAILQALQQKLFEHQQATERWRQESLRLGELLAKQKNLTIEARNKAKAMAQFIHLQQKEIIQQKQEALKLKKQIAALSESIASFTSRLETQARQFNISSPQS